MLSRVDSIDDSRDDPTDPAGSAPAGNARVSPEAVSLVLADQIVQLLYGISWK